MDYVRGKDRCDQSLRTDVEKRCGAGFGQDGGHRNRERFEACYKIAATYW